MEMINSAMSNDASLHSEICPQYDSYLATDCDQAVEGFFGTCHLAIVTFSILRNAISVAIVRMAIRGTLIRSGLVSSDPSELSITYKERGNAINIQTVSEWVL